MNRLKNALKDHENNRNNKNRNNKNKNSKVRARIF